MTEKEQLSAFVDNASHDRMLIDLLAADKELEDKWERYNLIGDAMRDALPAQLDLDIADKVSAALEAEPSIIAPVRQTSAPRSIENHTDTDTSFAPVGEIEVDTDTQAASSFYRSKVVPLFRHVGQYAIAASVAVAVIGTVQLQTAQEAEQVVQNPVLETLPFGGTAAPVGFVNPRPAQPQQPVRLSEEELQEQRKRINAFLQDHQLQQRLQP